jgi:hypothetical protein
MMKSLTFMISWLFLFLATAGQDKFPDFSEQSRYEIGGIVLNLGEEDTDAGTYAKYLERLIKDLRAEFHNDRFPVVIVGSGRGAEGGRKETALPMIIEAQKKVATLPEFQETVTYVETRGFCRMTTPELRPVILPLNAGSTMRAASISGDRRVEMQC